jgi:hypothetical protein
MYTYRNRYDTFVLVLLNARSCFLYTDAGWDVLMDFTVNDRLQTLMEFQKAPLISQVDYITKTIDRISPSRSSQQQQSIAPMNLAKTPNAGTRSTPTLTLLIE